MKTVDPCDPRVSTISPIAERGEVAEHLGLGLGDLQDRDGAEDRRIEVGVEPQRADLGHAHQPLRVVRDAVAAGQRGERPRRKVGAGERRDVDPADARRQRGQVAGLPRVADRLEPHVPLVAVVVDRADRRRSARDAAHRRAEPDERRQQLVAVGRRAPRDDARGDAQPLQRAGAVVRPAAGRGRPVGEDVAAEISEKRDHAPASIALRCTSARAHSARTKAAAKLGSEAPPHGSACGCRCATSLVHQRGPTGYSHW